MPVRPRAEVDVLSSDLYAFVERTIAVELAGSVLVGVTRFVKPV